MVVVYLSKALICISGACAPALVGAQTPTTTAVLVERVIEPQTYGPSVMQFHEDESGVYAIHRAHNQTRRDLLRQPANRRINITNGCINVTQETYDAIKSLSETSQVEVEIVP